MEIFKPIQNYENYSVSNLGNVKNTKTNRIMKPQINDRGYYIVDIRKNKNRKHERVHRLVAFAFLENPLNKHLVDHINNDKLDNNVNNLRFATNSENLMNSKISIKNKLNVKGVYKIHNKYRARIKLNGKNINIGNFDNLEDAKNARMTKANELFKEFTNICEKIINTTKSLKEELEKEFTIMNQI
jgi:hypothetical protein